jgi:hypothetical protein
VVQPLWHEHGIPLEWKLVLIWALIGLLFRRFAQRRSPGLGNPTQSTLP